MFLIDVVSNLFLRLVHLAGRLLLLHFADDLFEHLHGFEAALSLEADAVQFHAAVRANGDVKFALRHSHSSQWRTFIRMAWFWSTSSSTTTKLRACISSISFR